MLHSILYKKYYPILRAEDIRNMEPVDRENLINLMQQLYMEIETNTKRLVKSGYGEISLYTMGDTAYELMKEKLKDRERLSNSEMSIVIDFLNAVIYRNKYIPLISKYVCPRFP